MWASEILGAQGHKDLAAEVKRFVSRMPPPRSDREVIAEELRKQVRDGRARGIYQVNANLTAVTRVSDMSIAHTAMHRIATGHRVPAARWDTAGARGWGLFFGRTLRLEDTRLNLAEDLANLVRRALLLVDERAE